MKRFISILFYCSIGILPIGIIFNIQHWTGGQILFTLGLLGLLIYFTAKTIQDYLLNRNVRFNILLQIFIVLMSVILFSKYLYHFFGDYPGLLIIPLFIILSVFYLIKGKTKDNKLITATITYLILSIPLFGLYFHKSPRQYIPTEWYNRYNVSSNILINEPFGFEFKETEQLCIKAFDLQKSRYCYHAIILYRQALKIEPKNVKVLFAMSECYAITNQLERAVSIMDTVILLDSTYAPFYNNRGVMHYKLNKNNYALKDFHKAIQIDSTNFVSYANMALVYNHENDYEKACNAIQKAESLGLDITSENFLNEIKIKIKKCK